MDFVKLLLVLVLSLGVSAGRRVDHKIQRGYNIIDIKKWPFIGSYRVMRGVKTAWICTGILVDQFTAITAGHCVLEDIDAVPYNLIPTNKFKSYIVMGVASPTDVDNPFYQKRDIKKLFIHPKAQYNTGHPIMDLYDIGAMKWTEKVILNGKIQLIPLIPERLIPTKVLNEIIEQGVRCEMAGWGALHVRLEDPDNPNSFPKLLQGMETVVISKLHCCVAYFFPNMRDQCMDKLGLLVGGTLCHIRHKINTSMAPGDSGSPIYCPYKGKKYVVGMNIAGEVSGDPPPDGPFDVLVPSYFAIDQALRPFIMNVTGNPSGFSNRSERETNGPLSSIQFFSVLTWYIVHHKFYSINKII